MFLVRRSDPGRREAELEAGRRLKAPAPLRVLRRPRHFNRLCSAPLLRSLFPRAWLYRQLLRPAHHPVAEHVARQLGPGRRLPLMPLYFIYALGLFFVIAQVHHRLGPALAWTAPLWLMLFSALYCGLWIARIVALLARGARAGQLEELSVIPPGPRFLYLTIGKVVLNEGEAAFWLGGLRRLLTGLAVLGGLLALCIASSQLQDIALDELGRRVFELALLAGLISLEHSQSTVLAWLLGVLFGARLWGQIDRVSAAISAFLLLQILSYALALAVASALPSLSLALGLFLLSRELLVAALWHYALPGAEYDSPAKPYYTPLRKREGWPADV